ncbi:hypothetical protein B0A55_01442 [Friedmanniomyces simplex]|uniref:Uncharacterized protein n=1 Tax=Friedmanniomyces simplex TaxID=329884 RepID=A0A4U0XWN9_9PEZI|nr:hypothetical protein B0A55_01442 [Friedmanniomyces simplex]
MMADLGLHRRDLVSAPQADASGRPTREDPRAARAIINADEERRRRIRQAPAEMKDTDQAVKLGAWNSVETFATDGQDAGLEIRFNGQGHRTQLAELAQHHGYDRGREAAEARHGEERQLFLQDRGATGNNNYIATTQHARRPDQHNNSHSNSTPRSFGAAQSSGKDLNRGRLASSSKPTANRAPSPRAAGITRFVGGKRVQQSVPASQSHTTHRKPSVQATTPSKPSAQAIPPTKPIALPVHRPQPAAPATIRALPNGAPRNSVPTFTQAKLPSTTVRSASPTTACEPKSVRQAYLNTARMWAANPGAKCDDYYQRHPDQTNLLKQAQMQLIEAVNKCAKDPESRDTAEYLAENKEHVWMYQEALTAKSMAEKGQIGKLNARYAAQPKFSLFGKFATFMYGAKSKPANKTAPPPPEPAMNAAPPTSAKKPPTAAPTSPIAAPSKATPPPTAGTRIMPGSFTQVPQAAPETTDHSPTTNVEPPSNKNPLPRGGGLGNFFAVFQDVAGHYLGEKSWPIKLAANLTVTVQAMERGVNVIELMSDVEAFALDLGRTAKVPGSRQTGGGQSVSSKGEGGRQ